MDLLSYFLENGAGLCHFNKKVGQKGAFTYASYPNSKTLSQQSLSPSTKGEEVLHGGRSAISSSVASSSLGSRSFVSESSLPFAESASFIDGDEVKGHKPQLGEKSLYASSSDYSVSRSVASIGPSKGCASSSEASDSDTSKYSGLSGGVPAKGLVHQGRGSKMVCDFQCFNSA